MSILKKFVVFLVCFSALSLYAVPQYTLTHNKILINSDTSLTINLSGSKYYSYSQGIGYNVIDPTTNSIVKSSSTMVNGAKDITLQLNDLPAGHYVQLYTETYFGKDNYMHIGNRTEESQLLSFSNNFGFSIAYNMSIKENGTFGSPVPGGFMTLIILGTIAFVVYFRQRKSMTIFSH